MEIISTMMKENPCYKAGRTINVKGLMLHSVGCSQPNASVFINSWNRNNYYGACVHAFIDANNGNVYQTLPWNHRGWHAGGTANDTHIGIEMCEPACINYSSGSNFTCSDFNLAKKNCKMAYNSAVELFAKLCKDFNLNPLEKGVIISHKEGYELGIATNHGDPEHLWRQLGTGYTMDEFRQDVYYAINSNNANKTKSINELAKEIINGKWGNGQSRIDALQKAGYNNQEIQEIQNEVNSILLNNTSSKSNEFLVKVDVSDLNIRKGPGTNYNKTGSFTGKGVFTIVDVSNGIGSNKGWGKLKSGAGWIALDYAKRI